VGSYVTYFGGNGVDRGTSIVVDPVTLNSFFAGDTTSNANTLETQNPLQSTLVGTRNAFVTELGATPDVSIISSTISPTGTVSAGNQVTITFTVTNNGPDLATGVFVNGAVSSTGVTFNSATAGSGTCSTPSNNSVVCIIPTLQAGSTSTVNFVVTPIGPCSACSATAQVIKINNANTNIVPAIAAFAAGSYSVSISPSSQTVTAGLPAQYTVFLSPNPVFGANVALSCSALPAGASCNFTSSSVTLNGPQSTVLNLTTTPQPVPVVDSGGHRGPLYAVWLILPGTALLGLGASGKRRRGRWLGMLTLFLLSALFLLQPACSGGNKTQPQVSGTPTGTYSLLVTATSGSFSRTASFQLTVTP